MFEGIVLAAGRSHRAGTFKPVHLHRGRPLVLHAADCLRPWCDRVVVVAGYRHEDVASLIAGERRLILAVNEAFDDGMFSSVQTGAQALDAGCTGFFVLPVDCPLVGATIGGALIRTFLAHGGQRAIVPQFEGRGGHPVLLPGPACALILAASPATTLRHVVANLQPVRLPVAEPAVLMDLDTPAGIAALSGDAVKTSDIAGSYRR